MQTQQQTRPVGHHSTPLWYQFFIKNVLVLRNANHENDIDRNLHFMRGYVSALYLNDNLNTRQSELLYQVIDNAAHYAAQDITNRQRINEKRMRLAVQNQKEVFHAPV